METRRDIVWGLTPPESDGSGEKPVTAPTARAPWMRCRGVTPDASRSWQGSSSDGSTRGQREQRRPNPKGGSGMKQDRIVQEGKNTERSRKPVGVRIQVRQAWSK